MYVCVFIDVIALKYTHSHTHTHTATATAHTCAMAGRQSDICKLATNDFKLL